MAAKPRAAGYPGVPYTWLMSDEAWALVFMMLVLKIPIIYLGWVVWYAIRAEPEPGVDPNESSIWRPWARPDGARPRRGGPHGSRGGGRRARAAARRTRVAP